MITEASLQNTIQKTDFSAEKSYHGKVRDSFVFGDKRAIVVSDRISAFDFVLGTIPFKGAVLNQIAAFWFQKLDKIGVSHHLLSSPHPNISVVKNANVLPIEVVVRGYLTGSTKTSSWYAYQNLDRKICGLEMPAGMKKNEKFPEAIITPTTKPETGHDEPLSREEIIDRGLVEESVYKKAEKYALKMFAYGQKVAAERGLILVDTKYEMGLDDDGNLIVIDEVHTPDSSRYWIEKNYQERLNAGQEPESLDKEFVRKMIVDAGYDVNSAENPSHYLTDEIRLEAAKKYLNLYETITGKTFDISDPQQTIQQVLEGM